MNDNEERIKLLRARKARAEGELENLANELDIGMIEADDCARFNAQVAAYSWQRRYCIARLRGLKRRQARQEQAAPDGFAQDKAALDDWYAAHKAEAEAEREEVPA